MKRDVALVSIFMFFANILLTLFLHRTRFYDWFKIPIENYYQYVTMFIGLVSFALIVLLSNALTRKRLGIKGWLTISVIWVVISALQVGLILLSHAGLANLFYAMYFDILMYSFIIPGSIFGVGLLVVAIIKTRKAIVK